MLGRIRHAASAHPTQRYCAHLRRASAARRRRAGGVGRRARVPRRQERLGQVDAAEDRRRHDRARSRRAVRAAWGQRALPAAGAGFLRLRDDAGICGGRTRRQRRRPSGALSAAATRPARRRGPEPAVGRRGAPRGAGARAGAAAGHPAARRADQPPRPADHRMAGADAGGAARGAGDHQPRPPLPRDAVAHDGVARPRTGATRRGGLQAVRGLARRAAGRGGSAAAQARPQDRARGALGPLRRHRAAQAQRAAHGGAARIAPDAARSSAARPARR